VKPTLCKVCGTGYQKFQTTQKVCGPVCALTLSKDTLAKKRAKQTRKMRADMKATDRGYQLKQAQLQYNAYIRQRDDGQPCISCRRSTGAKMNAGHYLSVGAHPELRFNPQNCHLQCEHCNSFLSGNIARYRINLIEKISLAKVELLEGPHEAAKLSIDDIIAIKEKYRDLLKLLQNPESC
jgi:hypothetical protein